MPDSVICVDLSSYQRGFNFEDFKAGGGLGVILKASEGSFRDPDYSTFWDQAIDAGLAVGSYHFLRPGDMNDRASFFLNVVKPRQGERVVADYEIAGVSLDGPALARPARPATAAGRRGRQSTGDHGRQSSRRTP